MTISFIFIVIYHRWLWSVSISSRLISELFCILYLGGISISRNCSSLRIFISSSRCCKKSKLYKRKSLENSFNRKILVSRKVIIINSRAIIINSIIIIINKIVIITNSRLMFSIKIKYK